MHCYNEIAETTSFIKKKKLELFSFQFQSSRSDDPTGLASGEYEWQHIIIGVHVTVFLLKPEKRERKRCVAHNPF